MDGQPKPLKNTTIKEFNMTSMQISYRYNTMNGSKTTKTTIDKYIYDLMCAKYTSPLGRSIIIELAKGIREQKPDRWAGYLRESLICKLIDPRYITGYEQSPIYKKILCTSHTGASIPINIPASTHFALTSFLNGMSPNPFISEIYSTIDGTDVTNKSYSLRKILIKCLLSP